MVEETGTNKVIRSEISIIHIFQILLSKKYKQCSARNSKVKKGKERKEEEGAGINIKREREE
jgi:hypothetical protein